MPSSLSRDSIVAATRDLIVADGLEAVSLRRVGAALEVTAPALYAYVTDKRDLLVTIAEEEFTALIERFRAVEASSGADPVARTRAYLRAYVDHARSHPELFKTMFLFSPDIGLGVPAGADLPAATEAFSIPARAVEDAIAAGAFRAVDPLSATMTLWSTAHGVAEVLLMGFELDDAFCDDLTDLTIDTVVRGLLAD